MKQIIIIKNQDSILKIFSLHIEIITPYENRVIGIQNIETIYINETVKVLPKLKKLAKHITVFLINKDGGIISKVNAK